MSYQQIEVGSGVVASLLNGAGSACLILNDDPANTIWIGDNNSIQANDQRNVVPLPPSSSVVVDGTTDTYGICSTGQSALALVVPGGLNFFLPVVSLTLPFGKTTGARIVMDGGRGAIFVYDSTGHLAASIASAGGTDAAGNPYFGSGFYTYGPGWRAPNVPYSGHGSGSVIFSTGHPDETQLGSIATQLSGSGLQQQLQTVFNSPSFGGTYAQLAEVSGSLDTTLGALIIGQILGGPAGVSFFLGNDNNGHPVFQTGVNTPIRASDPANGHAEMWHNLGLPSGMTGTARIKMSPLGEFATVDIEASFTAAGTFTTGVLPSASYYPSSSLHRPFGYNSTSAARIFIGSSGGIQCIVPAAGTGGCTQDYPLD